MLDVVVVGLGNPGDRYKDTFHNIGFKAVDTLAQECGFEWKAEPKFQAFVAKGIKGGIKYHLLKPMTYMNLSGEAVRSYLNFTKLPVSSLIVVLDCADLPLGEVRYRSYGSSGGHNGLKSIDSQLGTSQYKRLRLGIGREATLSLADYVLMKQSDESWGKLKDTLKNAVLFLTDEKNFNGEQHERRE